MVLKLETSESSGWNFMFMGSCLVNQCQ